MSIFGTIKEAKVIDFGHDLTSLRVKYAACIRKYLGYLHEQVGVTLHPDIERYMDLVQGIFPIDTLVIGIRPYEHDIYPHFGSAISIDYGKCEGYPPSVQILAQMLHKHQPEHTIDWYFGMLATNYALAQEGILFLNLQCHTSRVDLLIEKSDHLFSTWIYELLDIVKVIPDGSLSVVCLGADVSDVIKSCVKSLSPEQKLMLKLYSCQNPASIHYQTKPEVGLLQYDPEEYRKWRLIQCRSTGLAHYNDKLSHPRYYYPWSFISRAAGQRGIIYLAKRIARTKIYECTYREILNYHLAMSQDETKKETPRQDGYVSKTSNYSTEVLRELMQKCNESHTRVLHVKRRVDQIKDKIDSGAHVDEWDTIETLKMSLMDIQKYEAFMNVVSTVLKATVPAIARTSTTVPPIIRVRGETDPGSITRAAKKSGTKSSAGTMSRALPGIDAASISKMVSGSKKTYRPKNVPSSEAQAYVQDFDEADEFNESDAIEQFENQYYSGIAANPWESISVGASSKSDAMSDDFAKNLEGEVAPAKAHSSDSKAAGLHVQDEVKEEKSGELEVETFSWGKSESYAGSRSGSMKSDLSGFTGISGAQSRTSSFSDVSSLSGSKTKKASKTKAKPKRKSASSLILV